MTRVLHASRHVGHHDAEFITNLLHTVDGFLHSFVTHGAPPIVPMVCGSFTAAVCFIGGVVFGF